MTTFLSARFTDPDHITAVATTAENGAVALSITDTPAEWQELMLFGDIDDYEPPPLAAIQAELCDAIDRAAEQERRKYITSGAGQAMTYVQKADEATRFLAAEDPVAADYPILSAEVGITAASIGEVAAIVAAAYQNWQQIGAAIEAVRLGTKKAIDAAASQAAARAVFEAVEWPAP
ncbi:hypothetical protein GR238_34520 [Rhizobium leguminosarum]|uniref:hypothetical protein n=1 Tax=Rhizobium ruizarguesonis TaxID=2081791 RepID=UPI0013BD8A0B|nr:hypothetical protein [Rhizobium ruizarguesonis]NEJ10477.1 hypothetical protein [Rhizobium ruizarguesonis]